MKQSHEVKPGDHFELHVLREDGAIETTIKVEPSINNVRTRVRLTVPEGRQLLVVDLNNIGVEVGK